MSDSSVPPIVFGDRGFVAPSAPAILAGVEADQNAAFGGGLNPAQTTPQGQLAVSTTAIISAKNDEFLYLANNIDPAYASGRMQDAIARIYFLTRDPARPTVATATCVGAEGTVIPPGARALDSTTGDIYIATDGGTIPNSGTIDLQFANTVYGPVALPAHSLSIYQAIPGWDTIDNAADGVLGSDTESRAAFEVRRAASVAANALNTVNAVRGSVLTVANVLDVYAIQNNTGSPVTVGGVTLVAHSIYVCVAGGASADIGQAIFNKLGPGPAMNGATTVTVQDTQQGLVPPYPSYTINYQTAAALAIKVQVSLADTPEVPADALAQIQAAIILAFAGGDGGARAQIGRTVYASRYYAPVAALGSWAEIVSILVGTGSPTDTSVPVDIDHIPTVAEGDITLVLV